MHTVPKPPDKTPQHRPALPPPNVAVIDAWLAAHGLPSWAA